MHEDELTRLVRIAKFAVHNSETQPLLAGYSSDFITDGITTIAMKQRREGESPEMAFSRVIVEDPDARVLMKARKLRPTNLRQVGKFHVSLASSPSQQISDLWGDDDTGTLEVDDLHWDMAESRACFLEAAQMLGRPQDYSDVDDQVTAIGEVFKAGAVLEAGGLDGLLIVDLSSCLSTAGMGAHKVEDSEGEI
jgi:hypothetical protein